MTADDSVLGDAPLYDVSRIVLAPRPAAQQTHLDPRARWRCHSLAPPTRIGTENPRPSLDPGGRSRDCQRSRAQITALLKATPRRNSSTAPPRAHAWSGLRERSLTHLAAICLLVSFPARVCSHE